MDIDCDACGGSGYIREAMEVTVDGKNIREVLEMSVDEAKDFFAAKGPLVNNEAVPDISCTRQCDTPVRNFRLLFEKENLIRIIRKLVVNGNTVVVVEHDEQFIREADYIIDMGPPAH